jgi:hypothetical protein
MSSKGAQPTRAGTIKPVVDWRRGAELLAEGATIADAARRIGCSRSQLSRRRNRDQLFQDWIDGFAARPRGEDVRRLYELRQRLHDAIDAEVQNGNVRVILWLADRLKLVRPPEETERRSPLDDLLQGMTDDDLKEFESLKQV